MANDERSDNYEEQRATVWWIIGVGIALATLFFWGKAFVRTGVVDGPFGDAFGPVTGLFTACALVGALRSISIQRQELSENRSVLREQAAELQASRVATEQLAAATSALARSTAMQAESSALQACVDFDTMMLGGEQRVPEQMRGFYKQLLKEHVERTGDTMDEAALSIFGPSQFLARRILTSRFRAEHRAKAARRIWMEELGDSSAGPEIADNDAPPSS